MMHCDDCGDAFHSWFAPNLLWNLVIGGKEAKDDPGGLLCPNCFIGRAEIVGISPSAWKIEPCYDPSKGDGK
jgi:hypothetical protein